MTKIFIFSFPLKRNKDNTTISKIVFDGYCEICYKPLTSTQKRFCSKTCSFHVYARKIKHEAIDHYGGSCAFCGINDIDMLCLHHIDGNGAEHREEIGGGGYNMNLWLKRNEYPEDWNLIVLCHNHNQKEEILARKPKIYEDD